MTSLEEIVERVKEQNRARAKRYYEKNKTIIAQRRKEKRQQIKEILEKHKDEIPVVNETPIDEAEEPVNAKKKPITKKFKMKPNPHYLTLVYCNYLFDNKMTYTSSDKELKPSTINKLKKNIKQFFTLTGENNLRPYLEDPPKIYSIINNAKLSIASKVDITVSILKLLNNNIIPNYPKAKYDMIDGYYKQFKAESDANRREKTTDDKHAIDSITTLDKLIVNKYGLNSKEHIIMGLYREIPKRDDFYLKIVETKPKTLKENYIVVPKKGAINVIISIHKTGEKYQAETETLTASLSNEIRTYIQTQGLKINDYLFTNKKLGPFIKTMFVKVGKPEINGPTALRHSSVATALSKKDLTVEESRKLAKTMKHSPTVQGLYNRVLKK
jgi:hypothetical protein